MKRQNMGRSGVLRDTSTVLMLFLTLLLAGDWTGVEAQRRLPKVTAPTQPPTVSPVFKDGASKFPGGMAYGQEYRQDPSQAYPIRKPHNVTFYYVFAQLWPNGYCMASVNNKCKQLPLHFPADMWTVRGLWVGLSQSGKHFRYCRNNAPHHRPHGGFKAGVRPQHHLRDQPHMSSQMAIDLDRIWPSLQPGVVPTNRWIQEWQTHGVCSGLGEDGYFGMILNLHQQFSMYNILGSASVFPDDIYTYRSSTLRNAVRQAHGFDCELYCRRRRLSANGRFAYVNILQEIHFCFNVDLQPIDCPARSSNISKIDVQHDKPFICAFDVLYPKYHSAVYNMQDPSKGNLKPGPARGGPAGPYGPRHHDPHSGAIQHQQPYQVPIDPLPSVVNQPQAGPAQQPGAQQTYFIVQPGGALKPIVQPGASVAQPGGGGAAVIHISPGVGGGGGGVGGGTGTAYLQYPSGGGNAGGVPHSVHRSGPAGGYGQPNVRVVVDGHTQGHANQGPYGGGNHAGGGYQTSVGNHGGGGYQIHGGGGHRGGAGGGGHAGHGYQAGPPRGSPFHSPSGATGGYAGGGRQRRQFTMYPAADPAAPAGVFGVHGRNLKGRPVSPGSPGQGGVTHELHYGGHGTVVSPAYRSHATHDPLNRNSPPDHHVGVPSQTGAVRHAEQAVDYVQQGYYQPAVGGPGQPGAPGMGPAPDPAAPHHAPVQVVYYQGQAAHQGQAVHQRQPILLRRPPSDYINGVPSVIYTARSIGAQIATKQLDPSRPTLDSPIVDSVVKRLENKARRWFDPVLPAEAATKAPKHVSSGPASILDAHYSG